MCAAVLPTRIATSRACSRRAHNGTAFLDEAGEMSLRMQAMLLRFLETGELQRVGADRAVKRVDVRIIAATNRDLSQRIEAGEFRADLYYRLNVILLRSAAAPAASRTTSGSCSSIFSSVFAAATASPGAASRRKRWIC